MGKRKRRRGIFCTVSKRQGRWWSVCECYEVREFQQHQTALGWAIWHMNVEHRGRGK